MNLADGFVAVDWGSTHRRAYRIAPDGQVADTVADEAGALKLPRDGFPAAVQVLRSRFGALPLLMAGMVGSNRGWVEASYVPSPATLADLVAHLSWPEPGAAAIVPGVSLVDGERADVMRGEEVQVFGLAALAPTEGRVTICHPGTHTKWVELEGGRLVTFRTVMTGELFSLLQQHSILADLLAAPVAVGPAFLAGVARGVAGAGLGAELFGLRGRALLGVGAREDAAAFASGLLIGDDVRTGLADAAPDAAVVVVGGGNLTRLYAAALAQVGRPAREVDGAEAFVAGMRAIAAALR